MTDVSGVLMCCDPEVRHELEGFILAFYYERLSQLVENSGGKIEFTLEKV
jgi:hypothetical protein